jgi:N-acetylglucosamine-6-phosphate deacetylase
MILLAGADLVLPDRVLPAGSVLVEDGVIAAVEPRIISPPEGATRVDLSGHLLVPGFVDVHVHGVDGHDVLDGAGSIAAVAAALPRYGVTAFCPTSIACAPDVLRTMLAEVAALGGAAPPNAARVLPAHLESNFINPAFNGAQPIECLRLPPRAAQPSDVGNDAGAFAGHAILAEIERHSRAVGIVTLAPELDGGLDLVARLVAHGHVVSIGHSGATYEQARAAIAAGASHATHLFNRMSAMTHRAPGLPGAVLESDRVRAELICDGFHVHPAMMAVALRAKGAAGVMAITDGTAGSGLPVGSRTRLGGRPIVVTARTAELEDGTLAGSVLTMDGAFRQLITAGATAVDAARMCATTPADQLGRPALGRIAPGAAADLVALDRQLSVRATWVAGVAWRNPAASASV